MSRIFNFPLTIFILILGNCLNFILNIFISNNFENVYPILKNVDTVFEIFVPIISFIFAAGYFFSHFNDWQNGFNWKIFSRWFFIFLFILPWLLHIQPSGVLTSPNDTFSFRTKPDNGSIRFCGVDQIIRDRDTKVIGEILLCEENIKSITLNYPVLTVVTDRGRVVYKKNFLLGWKY